jgi:transposase InsO family protein
VNTHILELLRLAMATSNGARLQKKSCAHRSHGSSNSSFRRCYGSCYRSKAFRTACKRLGLRQVFTRPYTPKTNGKAERFIQTSLREWAYAPCLQQLSRTHGGAAALASSLQLAQAARQFRIKTTYQPSRRGSGQPVEVPQLANVHSAVFEEGGDAVALHL